MTNLIIKPKPINKENFKKFGDMITTADVKPIEINNGYAKRYDGIANLNTKKVVMITVLLVKVVYITQIVILVGSFQIRLI